MSARRRKTQFTAEIDKYGYIVVLWGTKKEISGEVIPEKRLSFDQSIIVDGIIINVTAEDGVFPKEAALSAVRIPSEKIETELKEGRKKDQNIAASYTFDIKILDKEGNELQPTDEQKVRVSFTAGEVADKNLETQIYHISDEGTVENLEVNVIEDTAFVSADGFSLYTVEFTYDKLQYVLEGDSSVRLSLILEVLGLYGEVTDVLCSNTDLFTAEQFDGDWTVSALQPFTSEEWMTVRINDVIYKIIVTDNPSNPASTPRITYEGQVVDSITYRGVTINAVYRPYRASDATDGTYGCFVLCTNFYSRIYGISVTNMWTTSSVPQASKGYFTETRSPRKGDIIRFNKNGPHWALVKSVNGSTVTLIQQNYWYNNFTCAQVGVTVDASDTSVSFFRYSGWLPDNDIPSSPAVPDGDYLIVNTAHNGTSFYYVDIEGTALPAANHTNVILTGPVQGTLPDYDAWTLKYTDGYYTITQKGTDMALDVAGGSAADNANVQVYSLNNSDAQKWSITYNEKNGYSIRAKCSGKLLDAVDGGKSNGTNIHQYTENGSDDQSWLLIPYKPTQTLQNGRYILLSGVNSSYELDVPGDTGNVDNGLALQLWDDSVPSKYNSFDITSLSDGYYKIIHAASGKAVEIPGGSSLQSKRLALYDDNGSMAQKWAITQHGSDEGYVLRPFCSGYAMDLAGAVTSNGRSVAQYQFNWSNAQKWFFVKAEHSVTYNANGGFGAPAAQTKYYKEVLTLSSEAPARYGYVFKGWAETSGAAAATYLPGTTFSEEKDITLYAVWEKNTQDPIELFICHLYSTCLDREADEGGLEYWKGRINSGTSKGIGLAGSFVFSKEFTSKNYCNEHFVAQLYPALMGREADDGGLAFWVGKLESGVTREAMVNSFTSSNEYKSLCSDAGIELGPQLKDTDFGAKKGIGTKPYGPCAVCGAETKVVQFAERMYTECMKRPADTGGLAYWSKGLYEQTITGKSILNSFFLSSEMKNMGLANQEYVRRIYKTMLDRDPDTGGLNYWTGRLDNGANPTVVINGFIDSKEFSKICEDYGIQRK